MIYELLEVNITEYFTLPALAYDTWNRFLFELSKIEKFFIEIPDKEKYEFIRKCVYGGRVTCNRLEFMNKSYC